MKLILAVVVYDRIENISRWISSFLKCEAPIETEMIVIHNFKNIQDRELFQLFCKNNDVTYIPRNNVGMDIGAFQDVCRERLVDFPNDWDQLLWVTDDTLPMKKDFLVKYIEKKTDNNIVCLELSKEVKPHIRTTGFLIDKSTANNLQFPADPIIDKTDCYDFEHRSKNAFLEQINKMGKEIVQVHSELKNSYLWDTDCRKFFNRWDEYYTEFSKPKKIVFICPIYNSYPQIISSLICQTYQNWELLLIHDGPNSTNLKKIIENHADRRVIYTETSERKNDWGHSIRRQTLEDMKIRSDVDFVVITNSDNYYVPIYIEEMLKGFTSNNIIATYPNEFVHSYLSPHSDGDCRFATIKTKLKLGWIDCGCPVIRKSVACEIGWGSLEIYSDWTFIENIIQKYGEDKWKRILGNLFIHC